MKPLKKKYNLIIYLFTTCHTNRCNYRWINGCDVANRINGVPRPTYWGYCCRYQLWRDADADAVVCAGVKTCAGTASSPIVKRHLPQMWKQGSSQNVHVSISIKWQSSVSHGGPMMESIRRWSVDHATTSSQNKSNPHDSTCGITYFTRSHYSNRWLWCCGGWWITWSEPIQISDRFIALLLKSPCGLLCLQRSQAYKISSEILVIPLEKAQNK